ncbi:MAG: 23S rRNA (uracil(1939)-C(5))-methyltransferase RlmD [Streptococcaceae bacterium]|jgi:23S rRNA (uracil1939-C5)-methyltransferase|nr:23S rRNA (uracil(1939)-C(5))-methyltransferase RlmD [Streptococcaceae bacterium]
MSKKLMIPVKKNDRLTVEVIDLTHEGMGVAKVDGFPLFIENALPGERVQIHVIKVLKKFAFAKVVEYETKSPHRVESADVSLMRTGIAPFMHLEYPQQIQFKRQQIVNVMERIAKMPEVEVLESIGMQTPYKYRNKAQIPVRMINGVLETGFYRKNSHHLVPLEDYYIQDPQIDEAILITRDVLRKLAIEAYNEEHNTGDIKHIVVRKGHYTNELMIILVTRTSRLPKVEKIVAEILAKLPETQSIMQNINEKVTNVILGNKNKVLHGKATIKDHLMGNAFNISPQSFYQVNTEMAEILYKKAIDLAQLTEQDIVIDAYCGIGTIGQSFAKRVKHVYGVEIVPEAIEDAKVNAVENGIENTTYVAGPAEIVMQKWVDEGIEPTVIFVDPPRKGLAESFIRSSVEVQPERIVYISCNAATFARDVAIYKELGYELSEVTPVDLFPQTHHVECVGLLTRK